VARALKVYSPDKYMSPTSTKILNNLYNEDYYLWLEATVKKLKNGQVNELDLDNLIEELESMGKSEKRAIESLLTRLLEHLLKITYWQAERERNLGHWSLEVTNFRYQISKIVADSPSLKTYIQEIFLESYSAARKGVNRAMGMGKDCIPEQPIASLEQVLDEDWFPINYN
jgi:hypothetical protein